MALPGIHIHVPPKGTKTSFNQQISKERTNYLRLAALVIDGGKTALKLQFDDKFPPNTLSQDLRAPGNFQILQRLGNPPRGKRRILLQDQFDILFPHLATPPSTKNVDSNEFDVTLLACLIQNLPAFYQTANPVWTQKGYPAYGDYSLGADVKRLRLKRNEIAHAKSAALGDLVFQHHWQETSHVIKRLCGTTPGIQNWLDAMEKKSIDPAMEKEYIDKIKEWEWYDLNLKRGLTELHDDVRDIKETLDGVKDAMKKTESNSVTVSKDLSKEKLRIDDIKTKVDENAETAVKLSGEVENEKQRLHDLKDQIVKNTSTMDKLSTDFEKEKDHSKCITSKVKEISSDTAKMSKDIQKANTRIAEVEENAKKSTVKLSDQLEKETTKTKEIKEQVEKTINKTTDLAEQLRHETLRTDAILEKQASDATMSSQFKTLASNSRYYFEEPEDTEFVQTSTYLEVKEKLERTRFVVLSGHPGEGKSTMAKHLLMSKFPPERCLNIRDPTEWEQVDLNLVQNTFDAILIDDIFGIGVFEEALFRKWKRRLTDLSKATRKGMTVIIASRYYILEESKHLLQSVPLFRKENIELLSSSLLTENEKIEILESHLKAENRKMETEQIQECVRKHSECQFNMNDPSRFVFGFPQCVSLFAKEDSIFEMGSNFFAKPNVFFKRCIEELFESEEKILSLIVMWASEKKALTKRELESVFVSGPVRLLMESFYFDDFKSTKSCFKKSLDYHVGGLLHFCTATGVYSFSHQVIIDMVGLVLAQRNTEHIIQFCTRNFLMAYATTSQETNDFQFRVDEYMFKNLAIKFANIMCENISYDGTLECGSSLVQLNKGGKLSSMVVPHFQVDFSILKHESFQNENFVNTFLDILVENGYLDKILTREVMTFSGFLLHYGIEVEDQSFLLLSCAVYFQARTFANAIIARDLLQYTELEDKVRETEYYMALMFAVHHELADTISLLLQRNDKVPEEALYIAAHTENETNIRQLMGRSKTVALDKLSIKNDNNALTIAAKKGFLKSVKCLIENGYCITQRSKAGLTPLEKAIVHNQGHVCEVLLNAGVPLEMRSKKFNRTPLHTAVDTGQVQIVKQLLDRGARVNVKDHKGYYPIHAAATRNQLDIVEVILKHDPSQANVKAKSYGKKSSTKGMTIVHMAVAKKNYDLLRIAVKLGGDPNVRDWYGRTAFYTAACSGDAKLIHIMEHAADGSVPDKNGFTALHEAVFRWDLPMVKCLLTCNANVNVNAVDRYGKSPLHIAAEKGYDEIYFQLVNAGADWRMITKRGDSVLHLTVRTKTNLMIDYRRVREQLSDMYHVQCKRLLRYGGLFKDMVAAYMLAPFDAKRDKDIDRFDAIHRFTIKADPSFILKKLENRLGQYISPGMTTIEKRTNSGETELGPKPRYRRRGELFRQLKFQSLFLPVT